MKLWLVCFLILFFGAEAAQWLGQLPWVGSAELSLPLTVVGGIGLAIASNYRSWATFSTPPAKPETAIKPVPPPPTSTTVTAPLPSSQASRKGDTISFEIKKPRGKG